MKTVNLAILGSTRGTDLQAIIDAIASNELDAKIKAVISNKSDAYILERAKNQDINSVFIPLSGLEREQYDSLLIQEIEKHDIDLILLIGYMRFLSPLFVEKYRNRILNVHPSLLPAFAGGMDKNVHKEILDHGAKVSGCTIHFVDEGADTGPIALQKAVEVADDDTVDSLREKVQKEEGKLFIKAIKLFGEGRLNVAGRKVVSEIKEEKNGKIIVLDFGSQLAHLIANRVRRLGVYSDIALPTIDTQTLRKYSGIILSGGPTSCYGSNAVEFNKEIFSLDVPVLGICYGMQATAHALGGRVEPGTVREFGVASIDVKDNSSIFQGLSEKETVWMSHGDKVAEMPPGFTAIASTPDCPVAAMSNGKIFGFQFHPEVTHSENGMKMLENFIFNICKCEKNWNMDKFFEQIEEEIIQKVGNKKVFLLVSGGVDSTVLFMLLNKVLGKEKVLGVHIDTGFMRMNESEMVFDELKRHGFDNLHIIDAADDFIKDVENVFDPEEKRKKIGNMFLTAKDFAIQSLGLNPDDWIIAQGTIYPDTIESSGTKHSDKIKTHHNRVDLIQEMIAQGKVIEPLKDLYKDEVRMLGAKLGLHESLINRHPFPGPGLAIRCLCAEKEEFPENRFLLENLINKSIWETGLRAKILPVKSVGVQGDSRTYANPCVLIGDSDWKTLEKASTAITNNFKQINRCVWLVKGDLGEFSVQKSYLTKDRLDLLRKADKISMDAVKKHSLNQKIWQFPTILLPVNGESVVLRPVFSTDVMSCRFADLEKDFVNEVAEKIMELGVSSVLYDITHKPPATLEWE